MNPSQKVIIISNFLHQWRWSFFDRVEELMLKFVTLEVAAPKILICKEMDVRTARRGRR